MNSTDDAVVEAYIKAAAAMLGLTIEPEWMPGVKASLVATNRATDLIDTFPLPDEAEPAPRFEA